MSARVVVLASGSGTLLQSLLDASGPGSPDIAVVAVVSDVPDAAVLGRATAAGIPTAAVRPGDFADRQAWNDELLRTVS